MKYSSSNSGTQSTKNLEPERIHQDGKAAVPPITIDTAGVLHARYVGPRWLTWIVLTPPSPHGQTGIPIINITSPQVVIETSSNLHSAICAADPQVASGHIIQPEHGLEDDPKVDVPGKLKEHALKQDSSSDKSSAQRTREHRLEDDIGQDQPKAKMDHQAVDGLDGAASPPENSTDGHRKELAIEDVKVDIPLKITVEAPVATNPATRSSSTTQPDQDVYNKQLER